ncbi:uridine kinase family protein [Marinilactibacillus kalidii]|uniref:uridine kinase family protein n=1 Tax=Marinilactibacillus kalidii TaxID=2820274 RepID=UPI001ABDDE60|nr:phosphoribulokinase [Marinilactibacillus kalidii]
MDKLTQIIINQIEQLSKPIIIGISGHGASGKTTLALSLIDKLGKDFVNYLNTDPYIVSAAVRKHTKITYNYFGKDHTYKMTACHPAAHHTLALERDLFMIKEGYALKTMNVPYLKQTILSSEKQITLVEGMSVAFIEPDLLDYAIYLYSDDETEWLRRNERDLKERGSSLAFLADSHAERRIQYQTFMHPFSQLFNLVADTSQDQIKIERI